MNFLNSMPLVSVIIPTYCRASSLPRAIKSVEKQTYKNLEIIVANDNMPDSPEDKATQQIINSYKTSDPRVRMIATGGKQGGGKARNIACKHATGVYLAFLDDDDMYLPDKIQTQLEFMLTNKLDMSWQDVAWYNEQGKLVERRRLNHCKDFSRKGLLRAHLLIPIAPTAIYMLKKSLFDKTKGFGEVATGQDWWLMLRCIETGAKIGYMPGVHVHQFLHSGERLSVGANKVKGEMALHKYVQSYYPLLSKRDIHFIEFRHNAVLAFSSLRSGNRQESFRYFAKAFWASPIDSFKRGIMFFLSKKPQSK